MIMDTPLSAAPSAPTPTEALQRAFDLFQFGEDLMRQNLRRAHPGANETQIEALLVAWLQERPGAEHGDSAGRPSNRRFQDA